MKFSKKKKTKKSEADEAEKEKFLTRCSEPARRSKRINSKTGKTMEELLKEAEKFVEAPDKSDYYLNFEEPEVQKLDAQEIAANRRKQALSTRGRRGKSTLTGFDKSVLSESGTAPEFLHDQLASEVDSSHRQRKGCGMECIKDHFANSSLFIFHKNWRIRRACITLLKPIPEPDDDDNEIMSAAVSQFTTLNS